MITFHCEHCGHQINAQEKLAGRRGKCVRCGKSIEVPVTVALAATGGNGAADDFSDIVADLASAPVPPPLMGPIDDPEPAKPQAAPTPAGSYWATGEVARSTISTIIAGFGGLGIVYFAFVFDTTVPGGLNGSRTHNLGLINDRLVGIIVCCAMTLLAGIPTRVTLDIRPRDPNR